MNSTLTPDWFGKDLSIFFFSSPRTVLTRVNTPNDQTTVVSSHRPNPLHTYTKGIHGPPGANHTGRAVPVLSALRALRVSHFAADAFLFSFFPFSFRNGVTTAPARHGYDPELTGSVGRVKCFIGRIKRQFQQRIHLHNAMYSMVTFLFIFFFLTFRSCLFHRRKEEKEEEEQGLSLKC